MLFYIAFLDYLIFFSWLSWKSHGRDCHHIVGMIHLLICYECKCPLFFKWVRIHSHNQWRGSPTHVSCWTDVYYSKGKLGPSFKKSRKGFSCASHPHQFGPLLPSPSFFLVKSIAIMGFRLQLVTLWVEESKPGRCTCADEWRGKRMYVLVLRVGAVKLALMISILWHN